MPKQAAGKIIMKRNDQCGLQRMAERRGGGRLGMEDGEVVWSSSVAAISNLFHFVEQFFIIESFLGMPNQPEIGSMVITITKKSWKALRKYAHVISD